MDKELTDKVVKEIAPMKFDTVNLTDYGICLTEHDIKSILAKAIPLIAGEILGEIEKKIFKPMEEAREAHIAFLNVQQNNLNKSWQALRTRYGLPEKDNNEPGIKERY